MKYPKMILFDYGQTLFNENGFSGTRGTEAVLAECADNPYNVTVEEIQNLANEISREMRDYKHELHPNNYLEIHNHQFQNYLYEYFNITINISKTESEKIFWDAAAPCELTKNIERLLTYLQNKQIKIGVISNISFSGEALKNRIQEYLPNIKFEFILSSADYVFRKPNKRIFEIALRKAKNILGDSIDPTEIWYCGDNPDWDVQGSNSVGMTPIWYTNAIEKVNIKKPNCNCLKINDWSEVITILEDMR